MHPNATHGLSKSDTYRVWSGMLARCADQSNSTYGGKGVGVCARWRTFENFLSDMGERPLGPTRFTIDRLDNALGYSPENCRWATYGQQQRNYSKTILLTHIGKTMCLSDWAKETGLGAGTLQDRYKRGWPAAAILSPEKRKHYANRK